MVSRKDFVRNSLLGLLGAPIVAHASLVGAPNPAAAQSAADITVEDLKALERIAGITLTDDERKAILQEVKGYRGGYEVVRKAPITYQTDPPTPFHPLGASSDPNAKYSARVSAPRRRSLKGLTPEDIAFASLVELSHWVKTKQITSVELTDLYLSRLKKYGPGLECVVTLTEDLARKQAKQADQEIAAGRYRGPLHGIPYGLKDLFATKGIRTTWGAAPYQDYVPDFDAAVVEKLNAAGAVLVAKTTLGALANGDVWFGGVTKNPWNPKQGSSGSSAGSASATAAGLVGFSIGTETLGSICSPSVRCRTTGLRPTFGRVSRFGGMELSYTMDKAGPICREVEDCALVLSIIGGRDDRDDATVSRKFNYQPRRDLKGLKIGHTSEVKADDPFLAILKAQGAEIRPVSFKPVSNALVGILYVECGSAFDEFTRTEKIKGLKNSDWPELFRASRFIPAVEYLQMQRARTLLMHQFEAELGDLDAFISEGIAPTIVHTNLTGHPQIIVPQGDDGKGNSRAKSITGRLYREDQLCQIARIAQNAGPFHLERPKL
jgi:Asp-tRNA(Asn)/Glu-tRNA(Gln) amidotransferase A subunit family amidase